MQKKWLFLAVLSLCLSGIFSLFVVLLRLPFFAGSIPNIFDISLVLHVNLAVNFWMIAVILSIFPEPITQVQKVISAHSFYSCLMGMILVFFAGFIPNTLVIKSNYVPFADNIVFATGLALFFWGNFLFIVSQLFFLKSQQRSNQTLYFSICLIFLAAFSALFLAFYNMPVKIALADFYEVLFWGFGHILQFAFCQALIIIYFTLLKKNTANIILNLLSVFNVLFVLPMPLLYLLFPAEVSILKDIFSYHMRILLGIVPFFAILYLMFTLDGFNNGVFFASAALFIYGGLLGFLIKESNVIIPAHYHGSIVAITVAFMAYIYYKLNALNYKISILQIFSYALGQFVHINGLLFMGGYGALRKTVGMTGGALPIYKLMFAFGGVISILSGALFVILAFLHIKKSY